MKQFVLRHPALVVLTAGVLAACGAMLLAGPRAAEPPRPAPVVAPAPAPAPSHPTPAALTEPPEVYRERLARRVPTGWRVVEFVHKPQPDLRHSHATFHAPLGGGVCRVLVTHFVAGEWAVTVEELGVGSPRSVTFYFRGDGSHSTFMADKLWEAECLPLAGEALGHFRAVVPD
jgi:hypothetical protein